METADESEDAMKMKTYVLIDRSGSMQGSWVEMTGALAHYAAGIKKKLTAAVFDFGANVNFDVVHEGKAKDWDVRATMTEHQPRGTTPLYDAIGRLNAMISKDAPEKAQIVIITDGYENASREMRQSDVQRVIASWEKQGYDVVYLGASFEDAKHQAKSMGISSAKVANMADKANYGETMTAMSTRNMAYSSGTVKAEDDLGDEIRAKAGK